MIVRLSPAFCAYFNSKLLHRLKQFNIFVQERVPNVATVTLGSVGQESNTVLGGLQCCTSGRISYK